MDKIHLSDLFKFTHGFGQKGHQIGRKIGDALELIVLGMIHRCPELVEHMVIENGIEGATTAKHKVEFAFYKLDGAKKPTKKISDLFGIVECKKVGVEVTIKGGFKKWLAQQKGAQFCDTAGYTFKQRVDSPEKPEADEEADESNSENENPRNARTITIAPTSTNGNLRIRVTYQDSSSAVINQTFSAKAGDKFLITIAVDRTFKLLNNTESLTSVTTPLQSCIIVTVKGVDATTKKITSIIVEDCLAGPQTPEKAKQASFVSLDVRKKVLGHFDKDVSRPGFTSVLVIGEASHWETKSRAMIRLCNDHNLIVPDTVIEEFFVQMKDEFNDGYQEHMSKALYGTDSKIRNITTSTIEKFSGKVMRDMDTGKYKRFGLRASGKSVALDVLDV